MPDVVWPGIVESTLILCVYTVVMFFGERDKDRWNPAFRKAMYFLWGVSSGVWIVSLLRLL